MKYTVRIDNFEGPFELLFHLLEKNKINIYDIPISDITVQYLSFISEAEELDLEIASEFLVMASTLLQIKSKMLLPKQKNVEEEDPREELVNKLLEYKIYKEVSEYLKHNCDEALKSFEREKSSEFKNIEVSLIIESDIGKLIEAFKNAMKRHEINEKLKDRNQFKNQLSRDVFSIEDRMKLIKRVLRATKSASFYSLFEENKCKNEIVSTFLALLELLKLKVVKIKQERPFSEIIIYNNEGEN